MHNEISSHLTTFSQGFQKLGSLFQEVFTSLFIFFSPQSFTNLKRRASICVKKKNTRYVYALLYLMLYLTLRKKMHIMSEVVINLFEMLESGRHLSRAI